MQSENMNIERYAQLQNNLYMTKWKPNVT